MSHTFCDVWGEEENIRKVKRTDGRLTSFLSCQATADHHKLIQYQSLPPAPGWRRWAGSGSSPLLLSARYSWRSWDSRGGSQVTLWCRSVLGQRRHKIGLKEETERLRFQKFSSHYITRLEAQEFRLAFCISFYFLQMENLLPISASHPSLLTKDSKIEPGFNFTWF